MVPTCHDSLQSRAKPLKNIHLASRVDFDSLILDLLQIGWCAPGYCPLDFWLQTHAS